MVEERNNRLDFMNTSGSIISSSHLVSPNTTAMEEQLQRDVASIESGTSDYNDDPSIFDEERLKDPLGDRKIKDVPLPPRIPLQIERVFPVKRNGNRYSKPNVALIK